LIFDTATPLKIFRGTGRFEILGSSLCEGGFAIS
jgi:hypothetical protein